MGTTLTNNEYRERIIFLQGILENDAETLSRTYPNLVIFSAGESYNDVVNEETSLYHANYSSNESTDLNENDLILGSYIFKNGIKYNVIRGIKPGNFVEFGGERLSLAIDKNGLLRLVKGAIEERYFYVGEENPIDYLNYSDNIYTPKTGNLKDYVNEGIPDTTDYNHESDVKIIRYKRFVDIFDKYFTNVFGNYDYGVENEFRNFKLNTNDKKYFYILVANDWLNQIGISNVLNTFYFSTQNSNNKNHMYMKCFYTTIRSDIKMHDTCTYSILLISSSYNQLRIYNKSKLVNKNNI